MKVYMVKMSGSGLIITQDNLTKVQILSFQILVIVYIHVLGKVYWFISTPTSFRCMMNTQPNRYTMNTGLNRYTMKTAPNTFPQGPTVGKPTSVWETSTEVFYSIRKIESICPSLNFTNFIFTSFQGLSERKWPQFMRYEKSSNHASFVAFWIWNSNDKLWMICMIPSTPSNPYPMMLCFCDFLTYNSLSLSGLRLRFQKDLISYSQ